MKNYKQLLKTAGLICFTLSLFQAGIGFSPSLSSFFGAPEILVQNYPALVITSLLIAGLFGLFGVLSLSGAGSIQKLPFLKPILFLISMLFLIRGLFIFPQLMAAADLIELPVPVTLIFILFSIVSFLLGLIFITGTIKGWHSFSIVPERPDL